MPRKRDENETAFDTLDELLRRDAKRDGIVLPEKPKPEKMAVRVEAGRKGGKIGGKVRAARLSSKKKTRIAKKGARALWNRKPRLPAKN